jgi:hypothetical protein
MSLEIPRRARALNQNLNPYSDVVSVVRSACRHIVRTLNWAGSLAAVIVCFGGILGPDVHGLLHAGSHGTEAAQTCAFDGDGTHVEEDWDQLAHDDCTLCQRVETGLEGHVTEISSPTHPQGTLEARAGHGLVRHETSERGRGPPARG